MDHSKHQLFTSGITVEPLMLTFRKHCLGEVSPSLKGCCWYVKAINKFSWKEWIYVFLSLSVHVVNVCLCWSVGNGVSVYETFKQGLVFSTVEQQVVYQFHDECFIDVLAVPMLMSS